jgi:hypothetical protein
MAEFWRIPSDDQTVPSGLEPADRPAASGCATCGMCCKSAPGPFFPADLGPDQASREARARVLLESGLYSIDWWDDVPGYIYHLRPATLGHCGQIFDPSWGGQCALLGLAGCLLDRAERPTVCKSLPATPNARWGCIGLSKRDVADAWAADSDWLRRLGEAIQVERGG